MKKTFLLVVLMSLIGFKVNAQSSLIATLSHENDVKVFYGASALKEAHEAAVGGDVITLSAGRFNAVNISKAITLRGASMALDTVYNNEPTVLSGDFSINVSDTLNRLTLEGLYSNHTIKYSGALENAMFIKCRFKSISDNSASSSYLKNATFLHCRISDNIDLHDFRSSASMINCIIEDPYTQSGPFEFVNCVIFKCSGTFNISMYNSSFKNCILMTGYGSDLIHSSCTAYNCVSNYDSFLFKKITNSTNKGEIPLTDLFKTYTTMTSLENLDDEMFELTDEAKTKYLGTDGTQVGIYGGSMPFDITPTNPQITKCNVASKSTIDGKLSVDIQINAID